MRYNLDMKRVVLLGSGIDLCGFDDAIEYIKSKRGQVVTINPEMMDFSQKNEYFAQIIKEAELVIPDGIGVQIGLKIMGYNTKRIPGVEFARKLIDACAGEPFAMVGAKPEVVEKAAENLKKEVTNLNLVYAHDGYFSDDKVIMDELVSAKPSLVLVALGSPKQEEFIYKLKKELPNAIMVGVGGSFDVWSGMVKRAPEVYQKLGLEWLYRTVKEPKRFKRIFPALPLFVLKVLKEKWS